MRWPVFRTALVAMSALPAMSARADSGAGSPQAAQEASSASGDKAIEVVVTGTRTNEDSRRAPVRTDVVTRAEAERRGATNVGEALSGQLGVQVNPSAYGFLGQSRPSGIQIQGFDGERVLVLEDGERMIGDRDGIVDLATIPLTDVSRIELVAGPSSSLYGTNAIGGVVNVLSAPPEAEGFSGRAGVEGRHPFGLTLRGSGAYRRRDTWASLDTSFQRKAGLVLSEERAAQPTDVNVPTGLAVPSLTRGLVGLRVGTRLGDRISLMLRGRWIRDDLLGLETERLPTGTKTYDLPERTDRFAFHLVESIELPGGASLRLSASQQWFTNTSTRDQRDAPLDDTHARSDAMHSAEVVATIPEGSARTYVIGARVEAERFEQQLTTIRPLNTKDLVTTTTPEVAPTSLGSGALFGQLRWAFGDMLTVLPGVRAEAHLRYGGVVAPRLAVSFSPWKALLIRASAGRGFRSPGAKEFGFNFDHSIYGYCVLGNQHLQPETSWGVNGDITLTPQRGLMLRAGTFANWVKQLIDFQFLDEQEIKARGPALMSSNCGNVMTVAQYENVARARTFGAQLDASYRVRPWLRVETGYAYLWTRDDTNEQPLQSRPPHTVTSAVTATLPFKVELYLRYRAVTDAFVDVDRRSLPFQTLDARLARELWPKAKAYVGVQNILGAQKDPARCDEPRERCVDQRPLEGRIIYLGLTAEAPWKD
jgi:outer membrane receptor for ferrienterochelin and colicins